MARLKTKLDQATAQIDGFKEDREGFSKDLSRQGLELRAAQRRIEELESAARVKAEWRPVELRPGYIAGLKAQVAERDAERDRFLARIAERDAERDRFLAKIAELEVHGPERHDDELRQLRDENAELRGARDRDAASIMSLTRESAELLEAANRANVTLGRELAALKRGISKSDPARKNKDAEIARLRDDVGRLQAVAAKANHELQAARGRLAALESQLVPHSGQPTSVIVLDRAIAAGLHAALADALAREVGGREAE